MLIIFSYRLKVDCSIFLAVARLKNHPGAVMITLNTSNRDAKMEEVYATLVSKE